jgi:tetratricopeptide (TPR) repeat protein
MKVNLKFIYTCICLSIIQIRAVAQPYQTAVLQRVLTKLYDANSQFKKDKPTIAFKNTLIQVAGYVPKQNLILFEEKAYQICQSMGNDSLNAMAFLLGHELTHFYQHSQTKVGFITNFLSYDKTQKSSLSLEKEADIQGAFNAYLAGFEVDNNISTLLDKVYTTYQLKGKILSGYPVFEERQRTAKEVQEKVRQLIDVYETGNWMLAMEQYDFARLCYEYVARVYQNREIYNNLGVLAAFSATNWAGENQDALILPYQLDWETRLSPKKSRGTQTQDATQAQQRMDLLQKAKSYFEKAADLDKNYVPARINQICVLVQLGDVSAAESIYKKNKNRLNGIPLAFAKLALANNSNLLKELTQHSYTPISELAKYNLAILNKENIELETSPCAIDFNPTEIDGVKLNRLPESPTLTIDADRKARLSIQKKTNSIVVQARMNGYQFAFQRVKQRLPNAISNISKQSVLTNVGILERCETEHLVFRFNKDKELIEWVRYYGE